jgi:hypothetical protein
MAPNIFFQLSDSGKHSMLVDHGIYIREKKNSIYTTQLYFMDNNYYEVWVLNSIDSIIHISLLEEENALILFPGKCERDLLKQSKG